MRKTLLKLGAVSSALLVISACKGQEDGGEAQGAGQYPEGNKPFVCNPKKNQDGFYPVAESLPPAGQASLGAFSLGLRDDGSRDNSMKILSPHTYFGSAVACNAGQGGLYEESKYDLPGGESHTGESGVSGKFYFQGSFYIGAKRDLTRTLMVYKEDGRLNAYMVKTTRPSDRIYLGYAEPCQGSNIAHHHRIVLTNACVVQYSPTQGKPGQPLSAKQKVAGGAGSLWVDPNAISTHPPVAPSSGNPAQNQPPPHAQQQQTSGSGKGAVFNAPVNMPPSMPTDPSKQSPAQQSPAQQSPAQQSPAQQSPAQQSPALPTPAPTKAPDPYAPKK